MYLGRTLDVPSHYFVFTKRIFLVIIILYKSLTALRILKILSKAQKKASLSEKKIAKPYICKKLMSYLLSLLSLNRSANKTLTASAYAAKMNHTVDHSPT